MPVIRGADAPTFTAPNGGATFLGLASPSRGSSENSTWRVTIHAGEPGMEHSLDHEELFVLLDGRLVFTVGGEETEVGPGDCVIVPAHTPLSVANPHAEPLSVT